MSYENKALREKRLLMNLSFVRKDDKSLVNRINARYMIVSSDKCKGI